MTAGPDFDSSDYWERRLRDHFGLEGVGYLRLGRRYNRWMYRVRGEVFDRVVAEHMGLRRRAEKGGGEAPGGRADRQTDAATDPCRVLDVGSGTGFYVDRWLRLGAAVTGLDLTDVAVTRLAAAFPQARFLRADIGAPLEGELAALAGTMDAVSAFDVLFHIVDDGAYRQALANVARLLRPGGLFLWSDNFVHRPTIRVKHQVSRPLAEITSTLAETGLTVVDRVPMFVLMNHPTDTRTPLPRWAWTAMVAPAMASDLLGGALGALLYPIERRLVRRLRESPSTELMVCRAPGPPRGGGPGPAA